MASLYRCPYICPIITITIPFFLLSGPTIPYFIVITFLTCNSWRIWTKPLVQYVGFSTVWILPITYSMFNICLYILCKVSCGSKGLIRPRFKVFGMTMVASALSAFDSKFGCLLKICFPYFLFNYPLIYFI